MSECIFCKIANGEIPSAALFEDEKFRVILDLGPASRGHALILPKAHYADIYEIPGELAAEAMVLAKKMAVKMTEVLKCDGFNIVQNNGEVAGQTVFHFHMHLIPRYEGDNVALGWKPGSLTEEDRESILAAFQKK
ncbi:HIT family protein [Lactonifactor longoviformis]|uniref:Histidine triad (HIT) family protein n=1 Tax=Lactonifactor longoviformis DSM 17459 TaxID=1122155 RepID=A0A1M4WIY0_9CLOT|nr:HIT family protein [Lactonifactor longoviformis]POP30582.1 HIT family protein [Lactonifactor longoviformis]SHE81164.1 histidine triad (HIT) family protein [Lactonifactor longoviformis DSM 17459]